MIKNLSVLITLAILLSSKSFSQNEKVPWLKFETSITGDFIKNLSGGLNKDYTYIGLEELGLTFDFAEMGLWEGGELYVHGLNSHGLAPSTDIVGDLQVSSNLESGDYTGLYQYYFSQTLGDFNILFGQHDLNSEFVGTEYGGTFINSSFGITPTMSLNVPVSIYPMAAPALIAKYNSPKRHVFKLGVYDGDPGNPDNNRYNLQPNISLNEGLLFIGEYQYDRLINSLPENYKLGGYYHTNDFTSYKDTNQSIKGNYGVYAVADFVLWSGFNHPDTYLGFFLQGGWAPGKINQVDGYLGAGMHLNGMLPKRFNDAFGVAFAYANISNPFREINQAALQGETAIEFTYKIHIFDHYSIQPNLQYILNPGVNPNLDNALVATIRFNISFEN